ncbi:response regulator [Cesiribacter sp. SM1]|uniref:response regulator n=1 Tax=Cesiribacter sp. SM1 TaxID=2861196 RepID=UPI001CD2C7D7|nr:response regulator [Cesiribacter sp. SM1]
MAKIQKILFVDDDMICTYLNVTLVEGLGIAKRVESLHGAEEALEYIQEHYSGKTAYPAGHPDLIFLDIKMPGMDGFEFLEELDKLKGVDKSRFLVILLTASLNPCDQERAMCHSDKVFTCLAKPLAEEDVKKLLQGMLKTR